MWINAGVMTVIGSLIGGFSYSEGLEAAIHAALVSTEEDAAEVAALVG